MAIKTRPITAEHLKWLDESLRLNGFFSAHGAEGALELLPSFTLWLFPKGEKIISEGLVGDVMYVLHTGCVQVLKKKLPRMSVEVGRLKPGDFFGEVGFLAGTPRIATVIAVEDSQAFSWSPTDMRQVLEENADFAKRLEAAALERVSWISRG